MNKPCLVAGIAERAASASQFRAGRRRNSPFRLRVYKRVHRTFGRRERPPFQPCLLQDTSRNRPIVPATDGLGRHLGGA